MISASGEAKMKREGQQTACWTLYPGFTKISDAGCSRLRRSVASDPSERTVRVHLLIVEDDPAVASSLDEALVGLGFDTRLADSAQAGWEALWSGPVDVSGPAPDCGSRLRPRRVVLRARDAVVQPAPGRDDVVAELPAQVLDVD